MKKSAIVYEDRPCKYCGKSFSPKRSWQVYCRESHRVADFTSRQPNSKIAPEELSGNLKKYVTLMTQDLSKQTHCGHCGLELNAKTCIGAFCSAACEKHFIFDKPKGVS